ncbi:MAG: right-handed parallel beta-helix repeat-containing protein, partial [Planctomycetota bacterium]
TIDSCIINNNTALNFGGGIATNWKTDIDLKNCLVTGNKAANYGGGIYLDGDSILEQIYIRNCTVTGNSALVEGGGLHIHGTTKITFSNNIVCNNLADNNEDFHYSAPSGIGPRTITVEFSLLDPNKAESSTFRGIVYGSGHINADPNFADPGYWDDNGTPADQTDDVWVDGDYHLKSQAGRWDPNSMQWLTDTVTSPCVDAGDPGDDWTDELWPHGGRINMGAYGNTPQASMSLSSAGNIADLDHDDEVSIDDFMLFSGDWLYEKYLLDTDLNRNGVVDIADFADFANEWLWP